MQKNIPPSQKGKHWKLSPETRAKQKLAQQKEWDPSSEKGKARLLKYREINSGVNNPMYGVKLSEESKQKHKSASLKMWDNMSEETKKDRNKKISESRIGRSFKRNPNSNTFKKGHKINLGRVWTEESREKISLSATGRPAWNKGKQMLNIRGEKHPNWKGGTYETERKDIEAKIEYKLLRQSVFVRDDYTDQKTRIRGGKLIIHHVLNFASRPDLRLSVGNCITLSEESHKDFHKIYGRTNNTRKQLLEFINK